jgi:hypothetical protein
VNTKPDSRAAWAGAALGTALTAAAFWPGLMSVDSAVQYAQALGLRPLDDVVPPLMTLAWRGLDALLPGPGGMFLALVVAWWGGLAVLVSSLSLRRLPAFALVLGLGLFPPTFVVLGHVWKDVAMAAALLWATAAILAHARRGRARWRLAALLALAIACASRQNAIFAVLPLLAWLCWPRVAGASRAAGLALASALTAPRSADKVCAPSVVVSAPPSVVPALRQAQDTLACGQAETRVRGSPLRTYLRSTATFFLLACVLAAAPGVLTYALRARPTQAWTVVALWDLAALSLAADRVLIPPDLTYAPIALDELRRVYVPYANPPLFDLGKIQLSLYVPYPPPKVRELQRAWLDAVARRPLDYLEHRARLARYLLFGFPRALPRELVYVPQRIVLPGTSWVPPPVDVGAPGWRALEGLRATPLFAGALYLGLAALAAVFGRRNAQRGALFALAASAWANALPLLVISGSAEFRYLLWSAIASLLAGTFAWVGRRARIG